MGTARAHIKPHPPSALDRLDWAVEAFVRAADALPLPLGHERAIETGLSDVLTSVRAAEREGVTAPELLARLDPVRAVHAQSELWRRLQSSPRGVTADYITLDLLLSGSASAARGTAARVLEDLLFASPIVEHRRLVLAWQQDTFRRQIVESDGERRVLYLGCGSARDISALGGAAARDEVVITLNDVDGEAVEAAARHLKALRWRVRVDQGHASKRMSHLATSGPFDLVLMGTLPDQLSGAQLEWLLPQALRATVPGGTVCFATAQAPYPSREWLAYCAAWRLFERSTDAVAQLLKRAGVARWATVESPRPELLTLITVTRP